jgi:L-lactate dehydrogenase (cytochrome)
MDVRRLRALIGSGPRGIDALHTVEDFRIAARSKLPSMVWDFVDGGADGELAMAANRASLDEVLFEPRYLVDVADRVLSTHVFGTPVKLPLILSPSGLATVVHPDGEPAVARAAADAGAIYTVSTASGYSMEEIAEGSAGRLWFQLYLWKSEAVVQSLISRAAAAGYEALVVTVDVPVVGKRERDLRNGMSLPIQLRASGVANAALRLPWLWRMLSGPEITFANLRDFAPGDDASSIAEYANRELTDPARTWSDLALIRRRWDGPLLVKGVLSPADALTAVKHGADGIIVSNHGGRQMSSVPGVAAVMPRIADAVGDRAEVFLDGGVRRGEDIVKARALGATAACGGRLWFWGLAAGGEQGVRRVLSILEADADRTLALIGRRCYDDVHSDSLFDQTG